MMERLIGRGEEIAREAQVRRVRRVAQQLRALLGAGAVDVQEERVVVRGRGMIRRWLIDPSLRFLAGGLR